MPGVGVLACDSRPITHSGAAASDSHRLAFQLGPRLRSGTPANYSFAQAYYILDRNASIVNTNSLFFLLGKFFNP